jgi:tetratricopeptide (TPR) repeat protein
MSRIHAVRGRLHEAIEWIDRAIEIAPERAFYRARRGLLQLQLGDVAGAATCIQEARDRAPDNVFDAELVIALYMAQGDRERLRQVATGEAGRAFSSCQRAYAWIALGDYRQALATYEQATTTPRAEVGQVLNDDWVWRLPHSVTRAHLHRIAGQGVRADEELRTFIAETESLFAEGAWNGDVLYWAATAHALLGDMEQATATLRSAIDGGWRHAWWAKLDWNFAEDRHDPRMMALLERAKPA